MTKSPDEIKKGLECCADGNIVCAGNCVFDDDVKLGYPDCVKLLMTNALVLIQQLQAENTEKDARIRQLEAERDAAVAELANSDSPCDFCKYLKKFAHETPCNNCVHVLHGENSQFKWRGVQKEE